MSRRRQLSENEMYVTPFELPDGAEYGGNSIEEIVYNHDLGRVCVIYEVENDPSGWDQLIFKAERRGEQARITGTPPGLVAPEMLPEDGDSPGSQSSKALYELLEKIGIEVAQYE